MTRKGPKKITKRDEKDCERKREQSRQHSVEVRKENQEKALKVYKTSSNPNMPATKGERRALRTALAAEGITLENWKSPVNISRFSTIARERFVNAKHNLPCDESDGENDFESDAWLEMYNHFTRIEERNALSDTSDDEPVVETSTKNTKISRNEARMKIQPSEKEVPESPITPLVSSSVEEKIRMIEEVPEGCVYILNSHGFLLTADASGQLYWNTADSTPETPEGKWSVQKLPNGKYSLRSSHGKYLCNCPLWGFTASRDAAATWEHFSILPSHGNQKAADKALFCLQSWLGSYMCATPEGKTETRTVADAWERFTICTV